MPQDTVSVDTMHRLPLGSYLMCFRFLQVAFTYWRTGELPHHDHAHVEGIDVDAPGVGVAEVTR